MGRANKYWANKTAPTESEWRRVRVYTPPPSGEEAVCDRMLVLQTAAALRQEAPPCTFPRLVCPPIEWQRPGGSEADGREADGDTRLRGVVPLFTRQRADGEHTDWSLVATHVSGRTGCECRQRWALLCAAAAARQEPRAEEEEEQCYAAAGKPLVTEAEGVQLRLSSKSNTGYLGVCFLVYRGRRPFLASTSMQGKFLNLGYYDTAVEAAVAASRYHDEKEEAAAAAGEEAAEAAAEEAEEEEADDEDEGEEDEDEQPELVCLD